MKVTPQLQVEPELGKFLRRLTPDELALLESSLLAEGVRDPLVVWRRNGERVLLDGHHRYEIARRHGLDFRVQEIELADLAAAKRWVIRNQLGRRNLTPAEVAYYRGCAYLEEKKAGCGWEDRDLSGAQNAHRKTCEVLAAQHGVNQATIRRDAEFARALDRLAELYGDEFPTAVLCREAKLTKADVLRLDALSQKDPERAKAIVGEVLGSDRDLGSRKTAAQLIVSSESNEYYTPAEYIGAAREVLGGIDVDPASCEAANKTVRAAVFYDAETDGLTHDWPGRVWLNPPYGRLAGAFVAKLTEQYKSNITTAAIALVNAHCTDTDWFQPLWDGTLCFTDHRIDFVSPAGSKSGSTHGSVFAYLGPYPTRFAEVFRRFGPIVRRWP